MNDDLVQRLRRWTHAVDAVPAGDIMDEAADCIERLRLTDAEREAIVEGLFAVERQLDGPLRGDLGGYAREQRQAAATLRELLARLG